MPTIIRAADLHPRPWPNGLGTTRDITVQDGWLITVADLTGDAAFSHFPGIDRLFTLLGGAGVTLTLEGRPPLPCLPLVPASFPGDMPTHCRMAGGPARAFNVMAERGRFEARVAVRSIAAAHHIHSPASCVAVFCAEGSLTIGDVRLGPEDTILHPGAVAIEGPGVAIFVEI
ncbi:HutD family protein [Roseomonas sp. KE2513]|uniref:HutD/Ves family protein n=1 Tax=Roseomonas sp. KE2513 TaxID=2479202 RepID=UPI0018E0413F|nr:HutD family protein [Roseomonas sp. KE2513]MBI0536657.1 HutD family protein [Roseomonas sp. KE2513]